MIKSKIKKDNSNDKNDKEQAEMEVKDYAILGKALTRVFARDYLQLAENWRRFIWLSFVRGLFIGFGSVLGASLLIGLLLWLLSVLGDIPLIGNFLEGVRDTIETEANGIN